jgi:hypothetical protein
VDMWETATQPVRRLAAILKTQVAGFFRQA